MLPKWQETKLKKKNIYTQNKNQTQEMNSNSERYVNNLLSGENFENSQ